MNLKIHNINTLSTPWLKLHGCEITSPEEADFIIYEQLTDHVASEVDRIKKTYPSEKIVFILSGDINISDDKHIWFVQNCEKQTDIKHQIYVHNPRIWNYKPKNNPIKKDIFGCFSGTIWDTPERQALKYLSNRWKITDNKFWDLTPEQKIELAKKSFAEMERSIYTLCPKGCGVTSMRVLEALACGSIPILINDFSNPFNENFGDLVIRLETKDVKNLDKIIDSLPIPDESKFQKCIDFYKNNVAADLLKDKDLPWAIASGFSYKIINVLKSIKLKRKIQNMNIVDGNNFIGHYLKNNKAFVAGKIGGAELKLLYYYLNKQPQSKADIIEVSTISGVQPYTPEIVSKYANSLLQSLKQVDALALWDRVIPNFEKQLCIQSGCHPIRLHDLEPYYYDDLQWSKQLKGKNVLLISPFAATAEKQYRQRDKIWPNGLLPDFNLITIKYPTSNLLSKNPVNKSIFDFIDETKDKISKIDFDVAIIGAGAASLLLATYIKSLNKSAIHMGGATQILFGIRGNRWDNFPQFQKFFNEYWTRPSKDETPENAHMAEGACYW